ncbi:MAG: hypothetical protein NZZ41_06240 [Candidatus Dojkabacteria bacterium]|nr:hypothetical protein [Candidatus Dojkabacteria bacterium]
MHVKKELLDKIDATIYNNKEYNEFRKFLDSNKRAYKTIKASEMPAKLRKNIDSLSRHISAGKYVIDLIAVVRTPAFISYPGTGKTKSITNYLKHLVREKVIEDFLSHDMMKYDSISSPFGVTLVLKKNQEETYESFISETGKYKNASSIVNKMLDYFASDFDAALLSKEDYGVSSILSDIANSSKNISLGDMISKLYDLLEKQETDELISKSFYSVFEIVRRISFSAFSYALSDVLNASPSLNSIDMKVELSEILSDSNTYYALDALSMYLTNSLIFNSYIFHEKVNNKEIQDNSGSYTLFREVFLNHYVFAYTLFLNELVLKLLSKTSSSESFLSSLSNYVVKRLNYLGFSKHSYSDVSEGIAQIDESAFVQRKRYFMLASKAIASVASFSRSNKNEMDMYRQNLDERLQEVLSLIGSGGNSYILTYIQSKKNFVLGADMSLKIINISEKTKRKGLRVFEEDEFSKTFSENDNLSDLNLISSIAEDFYNSAISEMPFKHVFGRAHELVKKAIFRLGNMLNFATGLDLDIQQTYDVYFKGLKLGEKKANEIITGQNKLSFVFPDVVEDFIQKARSSYNRWLETKKGNPGIYVLFLDEFFHLFSGEAAGAVPALWDGLANRADHFPPNMLLVLAGNSPRAAFFSALNSATSNSKISIDSMKAFFDRLDTYFVLPDVDFAYDAVSSQIINDISFAHNQLNGKAYEKGLQTYKYILEKVGRNFSYDYYSIFVKPRREYRKKTKYSEFIVKNIVDYACNSSTRDLLLTEKIYKLKSLYASGDEKTKQSILVSLFAGITNLFYEVLFNNPESETYKSFNKFLNEFLCSNYDLVNIIKFQSVWLLSLANAYYKTIEIFRLIFTTLSSSDLNIDLDMLETEKSQTASSAYQNLMSAIDKKEISNSNLIFVYLFLTVAAISFVSSLSDCDNCIKKLASSYNYIVKNVDFAGAGGIQYPKALLMCDKLPESLGFKSKYEVRTEEFVVGKNRFSLIYYKEILSALVKSNRGEELLADYFANNYEDNDTVNLMAYQFIKALYKYEIGSSSETSFDIVYLVPESIPDKQKNDFIKAVNVVLYALANRFNIFGENASFGFSEMLKKVVYPITSMSQRTLASNISESLNNVDLFISSVARIKYIEQNFAEIAEDLMNNILERYEIKPDEVTDEIKNNLISFVKDIFESEKENIYGFFEPENMVRWMNNQTTVSNYHFEHLMRFMLDGFSNGQKGVYEYSHTEYIDNKAHFSLDDATLKSINDKQALVHLVSILPFYSGVSETGNSSALVDFFENKIAPIYSTIDINKFVDALNRSGMDEDFLVNSIKELGCSDEVASYVIRDMSTVRGSSTISDFARRLFVDINEEDLKSISKEKIVFKAAEKYRDGNIAKAIKLATSHSKELLEAYNVFRQTLFELAGVKADTKEVNYQCFLSIMSEAIIASYIMLYRINEMEKSGQYKYETFLSRIPYMSKEMVIQNVLMLQGRVEEDLKKILYTIAVFVINEVNYIYKIKTNKTINILEYELTNEVKTEIENACLRLLNRIKNEELADYARNIINTEIVTYIYDLWNLSEEDKSALISDTSANILQIISLNANNQALVELNKSMIKLLIIFLAFAENVLSVNPQKIDLVLSILDILSSYIEGIRVQKLHTISIVSKNQDNPKADYVLLKSKGGIVFYPNKFYFKRSDFYNRIVMYKDCAPMNDRIRSESEMDYSHEDSPGNMISINIFKTKNYRNHYSVPYLVDQGDVAVYWLAHNYIANPVLRGKKEALIATLITMLAYTAGGYDINKIKSVFMNMSAMSTQDKMNYFINLLKERKHVHIYLAMFAFETENISEFGKKITEYIVTNKESGYQDFDEVSNYISAIVTKAEDTKSISPQEFYEFAAFSSYEPKIVNEKSIKVCSKSYRGKLVSPIEIVFV